MIRFIRKFLALDAQRKRLLIQACFLLGSVRYELRRQSFKDLVNHLDLHREVVSLPVLEPGAQAVARDVGWAIRTAARYTPWESTCLVQVLTAQRMLQKRGIAGGFYLGASTEPDAENASGISAHAWLKCGPEYITGESGHEKYTVVSSFTWG
jgi:predicted glycoside hydrolase/deacetylase ChbG (UPF0249 family)